MIGGHADPCVLDYQTPDFVALVMNPPIIHASAGAIGQLTPFTTVEYYTKSCCLYQGFLWLPPACDNLLICPGAGH
jgi:hypothetical protein